MFRQLGRIAVITSVLLALPIWFLRAQPDDAPDLLRLFLPQPGCPAPCFMSIRLGVTTLDQTLAILEAHDWVDEVIFEGYQSSKDGPVIHDWVTWTWSEAIPSEIDRSHPGRIEFRHGPTQQVAGSFDIYTHLRMPQVQAAMPILEETIVSKSSSRLTYEMLYRNSPFGTFTGVSTVIPCPANLLDYWNSQARIYLTYRLPPNNDMIPINAALVTC